MLFLIVSTQMSFQLDIRKGRTPCQGVNLGGWLVVEHWITWDTPFWKDVPSDIIDQGEFTLMKHLGHEEGNRRFQNHRSTWITTEDIKEIKQRGLNTVRVPVGFFILGYDPTDLGNLNEYAVFASNSLFFLDQLINVWCLEHEIAVIVDIHAARGSQNGMEHSAPPTPGVCYWSDYPENIEDTVHVAEFLSSRYRNSPAFLGLGLLNEPNYPLDPIKTKDYYLQAYKKIRSSGNDCILIVSPMLSEQNPPHLENFMGSNENYYNVWVDWHPYFIWGYEKCSNKEILQAIEQYRKTVNKWKGNRLFFGEWSLGAPGCIGNDRKKLKEFADAQMRAFNNRMTAAGWTFWTWKHSSDTQPDPCGWSMRQLLREEILHLPAINYRLLHIISSDHFEMSFWLDLREGRIPCRGVNLGGWLVVDHWITWDTPLWKDVPSNIIDQGEFTLMKHLNHEEGIVDFRIIAPLGSLQMTSKKSSSELVNVWCSEYEIAVIIDIHGAKGSQNGLKHSGAPAPGAMYLTEYPENIDNGIHAAQFLCARYRLSPAFLGLELLNEPNYPLDLDKIKDYYVRAYKEIRSSGNDCIVIVSPMLSEQSPPHLEDFMSPGEEFYNVWVDGMPTLYGAMKNVTLKKCWMRPSNIEKLWTNGREIDYCSVNGVWEVHNVLAVIARSSQSLRTLR
uniref:glucan 1,3-beta-glucosidase n=1 Tax=Albugo laibachii Nc14 TaxID=890382 RepID=F0W463_9STRA|nr:unnamed protein product [Albugo laibachii Nc14]|eukprot:CCA15861.1 unnamed protein product [Albugo laibachii Nc14]